MAFLVLNCVLESSRKCKPLPTQSYLDKQLEMEVFFVCLFVSNFQDLAILSQYI